jgi:methionine-rich copper-binding protein CopC
LPALRSSTATEGDEGDESRACAGRALRRFPAPFRRLPDVTLSVNRARLVAFFVVASLFLAFPASAVAHAELTEATPADGAVVEGTPEEINARFNEPLETDGSTFSLRNAAGERLAVGSIDPDDRTRLIIDPVPELAPGGYEVRWRAASADGHAENDTWTFTVTAAPTPAPTQASTPGPTASASATPSATPERMPASSPSPSPGPSDSAAADGDVILPIIAGLAIVAIAAGFLLSQRGRPSGRV